MKISEFFGYEFKDTDEDYDAFRLFDNRGNVIYWELSDGYWQRKRFDSENREILKEASDGFWSKTEYGPDGEVISYDSDLDDPCSDDITVELER